MKLMIKKMTVLVLIAMFWPVTPAWACANVDHALPRVGSVLESAPVDVKIWFNTDLQESTCSIRVMDEQGNAVDKNDSHLDAKDKTLLIVSLKTTGKGKYKVLWKAACACEGTCQCAAQGDFYFTVKSNIPH